MCVLTEASTERSLYLNSLGIEREFYRLTWTLGVGRGDVGMALYGDASIW
jgi:hypothetical protein